MIANGAEWMARLRWKELNCSLTKRKKIGTFLHSM